MKYKLMPILAIILLVSLMNLTSALTIESVSSNPTEIRPGEKVTLSLTIENNLEEDAEAVTISLDLTDLPFAPYQSSNEVSFDDINEGKDKEARFALIADSNADSKTYKIPVIMSYYIDGNKTKNEGLISLIINADAKINLSAEDSLLIKGRNTELEIKIINSGLGDARLLSLKLKPAIGIKIIENNNVYVGDIDSDDFDSVEFKIAISKNAGSIISLPVEIDYRDSRNNEITETKTLILKTYTEKQAVSLGLIEKSNTTSIVIGIVALIVLYIIYRKIKKARKRRRQEKEE